MAWRGAEGITPLRFQFLLAVRGFPAPHYKGEFWERQATPDRHP